MEKQVIITNKFKGLRLSEYLAREGYKLSAPCGGRGTCGKCKVRVLQGSFFDAEHPDNILQPDENGKILSCRALCREESIGAVVAFEEYEGEGIALFESVTDKRDGAKQNRNDINPAALYQSHGNSDIVEKTDDEWGIALDIGTTTLAAALVNCHDGNILGTYSCVNPQSSFGADVICRISASENNLADLHSLIVNATAEIIAVFTERFPNVKPDRMAVSGNTTMLHLFCGVSPLSMGAYPFTPSFCGTQRLSGKELGLPIESITVMPSACAFIGSDITAGAAVLGLMHKDKPTILLDVGTNGEIVLCTGKERENRLICASAAAGPALEGVNISCGVAGVPGAVCRVLRFPTNKIAYRTIDDKEPCGICGCGLVDAVSVMLDSGMVDSTGYMAVEKYEICGVFTDKNGKLLSGNREKDSGVSITAQDIRAFQLAKSAVRSAIEAIVHSVSLTLDDIDTIYLAGGLGYYMDVRNAVRIGLLPKALENKTKTVGNTSLAGAVKCLYNNDFLPCVEQIAMSCENLELNDSKTFNEAFIKNINFI